MTKAAKCKTNTWTLSRPRYFLSTEALQHGLSDQTLHRWTGPEATYVTRRPYVRTRMDSGPAQTRIPVAGLQARFTVAIMPRNIDCNLNFGFRPLFGQPRDPTPTGQARKIVQSAAEISTGDQVDCRLVTLFHHPGHDASHCDLPSQREPRSDPCTRSEASTSAISKLAPDPVSRSAPNKETAPNNFDRDCMKGGTSESRV